MDFSRRFLMETFFFFFFLRDKVICFCWSMTYCIAYFCYSSYLYESETANIEINLHLFVKYLVFVLQVKPSGPFEQSTSTQKEEISQVISLSNE